MSPAATWLLVCGTSLLSSLLTAVLVLVLVRVYLNRRIGQIAQVLTERVRQGVGEAGEELLPRFRAEVAEGFADAADEAIPKMRAEVREGVTDAADAALPKIRVEVREGFKEALAASLGPRALPRAGTGVLDGGLSVLFGGGNARG